MPSSPSRFPRSGIFHRPLRASALAALAALITLTAACAAEPRPFALGGDVSWLPQMEAAGFVFRDEHGQPRDCLTILREYGLNTVRLRVWVHPSEHPRSGHCSPAETVQMAQRAQAAGFRILIDFHYSDTWADPGHQRKPAAWTDHDFPNLKKDVYDHTRAVLRALQEAGVTPEWVQAGNEISNGMLLPEGAFPAHAPQLAELITEGARATRSVDPKIKVIVHLDGGHHRARCQTFFDVLQEHGALYDVVGLSYYPWWLQGEQKDFRTTIDDLGRNLTELAQRYRKEVMVVEVGGEDRQAAETRALLTAVLAKVKAVPEGRGLGVLYWEPEGAASWSHYRLSAWGEDGRPTEALRAFQEAATAPKVP